MLKDLGFKRRTLGKLSQKGKGRRFLFLDKTKVNINYLEGDKEKNSK